MKRESMDRFRGGGDGSWARLGGEEGGRNRTAEGYLLNGFTIRTEP